MEERDGFLTSTRHRIEAAVKTNGGFPGIMVAHSMGNVIFRYFLEWLRLEMRKEVLKELMERWERRKERERRQAAVQKQQDTFAGGGVRSDDHQQQKTPGWLGGVFTGIDGLMKTYFEDYLPSSPDGDGSDDHQEKSQEDEESVDAVQIAQIVELSKIEGDQKWLNWLNDHIYTYVGLSAPLLGAVNPLRAVLSGENM